MGVRRHPRGGVSEELWGGHVRENACVSWYIRVCKGAYE